MYKMVIPLACGQPAMCTCSVGKKGAAEAAMLTCGEYKRGKAKLARCM